MTQLKNASWIKDLSCPLVAAPMFLVSGPGLIIAAVRAGIVGALPTLNARSTSILDEWLSQIDAACAEISGPKKGLPAVNIPVHPSNVRFDADLEVVVNHQVPLVFSIMGSPARLLEPIHRYGGQVFSDAATVRHARKAVDAGADGLVLLCAGAGGNTGWLSPFAFVEEVRRFFSGPVAVAGAVSGGRAMRAIEYLGGDLAFAGTPFVATRESLASDAYKQMVLECSADDIETNSAISGIPANFLRPSLDKIRHLLVETGARFDIAKEHDSAKRWKDIWSAGHGVGAVKEIRPLADVVADFRREYQELAPVRA